MGSKAPAHHKPLPSSLASRDVGIWRVIYENPTYLGRSWLQEIQDRIQAIREAPILRLLHDVYALDAKLTIITAVSRCIKGLEDALSIYLSARLLALIEVGLASGTPDKQAIFVVLLLRLTSCLTLLAWRRQTAEAEGALSTKVRLLFQERLLEAHLQDVDDTVDSRLLAQVQLPEAWSLLYTLLGAVQALCAIFSQLCLLFTVALSRKDGWALIWVCLAPFVVDFLVNNGMRNQTWFAVLHNKVYERLDTIWKVALDPIYRKELYTGNLAEYLVSEYRRARLALGSLSDELPFTPLAGRDFFTSQYITELLNHLPSVFMAINLLIHPQKVLITSVTVIEQTSWSLRNAISHLTMSLRQVFQELGNAQILYSRIDTYHLKAQIRQGQKPYPPANCAAIKGMGIEFRDVTFKYNPFMGPALDSISFTIMPSSMVVIVGENGSGKSSILNLITGLHRPTSGLILVDGLETSKYRSQDLRNAITSLNQEYKVFPFTVMENIGLGDPSRMTDKTNIYTAASRGGSWDFVTRGPGGFDRLLCPFNSVRVSYPAPEPGPLTEYMAQFQEYQNVSGGEQQRLAASRTFMSMNNPARRLIVVDEPTSSMDPIGEYHIYQNLRKYRGEKTLVIVSHRFGNLTNYADLILCMDKGKLVGAGTHDELMASCKEYNKLYDTQANAFSSDMRTVDPCSIALPLSPPLSPIGP